MNVNINYTAHFKLRSFAEKHNCHPCGSYAGES